MKKFKFLFVALLATPLILVANGLSVTTRLLQEGSTRLENLNEAIPNSVVVYKHTISNRTVTTATNLVFNDIVPSHTTYVEGSAKGEGCLIEYSIDGEVYDRSSELFVYKNNQLSTAQSETYKHIRWTCSELQPNNIRILLFKTKID